MLRLSDIATASDNTAHGDDDFTVIDDDGIIGVFDGVSGSRTKYKGHKAKEQFEKEYDRKGSVRESLKQVIGMRRFSSTLTMMQLKRNNHINVFNVGDSRAFIIRGEKMHRVSKDDTLAEAIKDELPKELRGKMNFAHLRHRICQLGPERILYEHRSLINAIVKNLLPNGESDLFTLENLGRILTRFRQLENASSFKNDQQEGFNPSLLALVLFNAPQVLTHSLKNADPEKKSRPQVTIQDPQPEDKVLVCTDGFYENLSRESVLSEILTCQPQAALEKLVHMAKTEGHKQDDITAILATVTERHIHHNEEHPPPLFVY